MTTAALVAVGEELLDGTVVDSNSAWLGRRLTEAGAPVTWAVRVGDDVAAISAAVADAASRAALVVVTGGLGPTSDDVTREALADLSGGALRRRPDLMDALDRWYEGRLPPGSRPPAAVYRQADVPAGAEVFANPVGSAPALRLQIAGSAVWAVPGVPRELFAIAEEHLLPSLAGLRAPLVRTLRTALLGESAVADRLMALALPDGVRIGYLASPGEVIVRFRVDQPVDEDVDVVASVVERARDLLGDAVVGEGDGSLAEAVHQLLLGRGATAATAESLTGGLVGAAITDVPGASASFKGAVVAYSTALKAELLGVDTDLLAAHGAVHPDVAVQMALGVRERLGATYSVATTGVAGPDPQDGHPVGELHIAVAGPGREPVVESPTPVFRDRHTLRSYAVVYALDLLRRRVRRGNGPS